ncbi:alpha-mannosidase [Chloroflexota bacterium]
MLHSTRRTTKKIAQRLELITPLVYRERHNLPAFRVQFLDSPSAAAPIAPDVDDSAWDVIEPQTYWGTWFQDYCLRSSFQVPADWDSASPVALYLPLGDAGDFSHPESLLYIDGTSYAACDRHHQEIILADQVRDGQEHALALHGWTGLGGFATLGGEDGGSQLYMKSCWVVLIDQPTRDFVAAAQAALETVEQLDADDPVHDRLLNALDDAFKLLDIRAPFGDDFYASVEPACAVLKAGIAAAGAPLDVDVVAVGHAHIDVAWLWTLAQTRHKASRTFSTVLRLMELYPDYHFSQSQPQLYQYIQEDHPDIFEQIKQRVDEGRWEIMGGSWVEPDMNESGAESLARQFLLGRNYFRKHFGAGKDTPVFWLPDTFGYPWALPQLIRRSGLDYFITHKMSWNQFNRMPMQSFWWQGIDGTKVLTHFMTTPSPDGESFNLPHSTTYNGDLSPREILGTWQTFQQKEAQSELMTAFGYGDGGGGPTREMLDSGRELAHHPGMPRVRQGTVREFMGNMDEISDKLPTWNGELYLEYHRGTYTSQARTKRNNRKSEFLLHDAEFLATLASLTGDYIYPQETINGGWELVCLNQFHDILPGSSITPVYEDAERDYARVRELGGEAQASALEALSQQLPAEAAYLVANPTSFGGGQIGLLSAELPTGQTLTDLASGAALTTQAVADGTLVAVPEIAPYSVMALGMAEATSTASALTVSADANGALLENDTLRVEFDAIGDITRIYDKQVGREVLPAGEKANVFQSFEDRPLNFDAWDIDIFFDDKMWEADPAESITVLDEGPLRAGLEIKRNLRSSTIVQQVYLYQDGQQLDFVTDVDWHETHIMLKVAFPVDVLSPVATYDIQWGNIERPTHHNTLWDAARFEVCGYKWADLSESDYGVSLLNDCKYGYDVLGNVLRLTLLKSATAPDPVADQGEHKMTYSLFPHSGDWRTDRAGRHGTVPAGYKLNDPLIIHPVAGKGDKVSGFASLAAVDAANVIIETVKQAEDGNGVIVRLYENERSRKTVTLQTGFPVAEAHLCNLLEENEEALTVGEGGQAVGFAITPYQIVTVRLIPA